MEREKRKRISRLISVNGHQVLRANDYDLEGGERSVWDQELGLKPIAVEEAQPKKVLRTKRPKKARTITKKEATESTARSRTREVIKQEIDARAGMRAAFARENLIDLHLFGYKASEVPDPGFSNTIKDIEPPVELTAKLRPHQRDGLNWLSFMYDAGVSMMLGDEMGLGKTIQTISLIAHLKYTKKLKGATLIACPLSVLASWMVECKRFCPSLRVVKLHSSDPTERERLKRVVANDQDDIDIVVTTYEMLKSPNMATTLAGSTWFRMLVLDEGHICKNELSDLARAARRMHAGHILLLTGTPLQNNLHELWALLNLLHPDWFPKSEAFDQAFQLNGAKAKANTAQLGLARNLLRPLMLRRLKIDVEHGLPIKLETTIKCPLSQCQRFWYKRLLLKGLADNTLLSSLEIEASEAGAQALTGSWKKLQSLMMQLRKCCNHPYLFEGADPTPGVTDQDLIDASGKLKLLDRLLQRLIANGHRTVIFSQYTGTLDVIDDVLRFRGIRFCRLDGSTNRVQRTVDINAFNQPGSRIPVFIMSTRAGGLGVNLQTADTVVLFDSDWNPQADLQAMARVHRIGQTRPVHIYRLVTQGTVEERILQRAEAKLYLDRMVNSSGHTRDHDHDALKKNTNHVSGGEILSALTFGADAVVARGDDEEDKGLDDKEIDAIIDRTRGQKSSIDGLIQGNAAKEVNTFDTANSDVVTSIRQLKGVLYEKTSSDQGKKKRRMEAADLSDISNEWASLIAAKRAKKARVVMTKVKHVGMVPVLASSIENGDDDQLVRARDSAKHKGLSAIERKALSEKEAVARWEADAARAAADAVSTRQRAGRDYDHEDNCLLCKDGGDLVCCDLCPASYHPECLKAINFPGPQKGFGTWACPHHACSTCNRKSGAAGGLLFRCLSCPNASCEDHLSPSARIIGRCDRFEALGQRHPSQACFILCSGDCLASAKSTGEIVDEQDYGDAAGILGATGLDTTANAAQRQAKPQLPPAPVFRTDQRKDIDRLDQLSRAAVMAIAGKTTPTTIGHACPRLRSKLREDPSAYGQTLESLAGLVLAQNDGDATMTDAETPVIETVAAWQGVFSLGPAAGIKETRERMASIVLRIERMLEGWKTYDLQRLGRFLDVIRLHPRDANPQHLKHLQCAVAVNEASGFNRKLLVKIISIFLAWPLQSTLFAVRASSAMLGEHDAIAAENAALKKGRGIMARRAEAQRLRDIVIENKRHALNGDVFLYPLCPPDVAGAYGFPLVPQSTITVYTNRVAVDAATTLLTVVGRQKSVPKSTKKAVTSAKKKTAVLDLSADTVIASPAKKAFSPRN